MKDLEELAIYLEERLAQFRLHHARLLAQDEKPDHDIECYKLFARALEIEHILKKISGHKTVRLTKRQLQAKGLAP